MSHTKQDAEEEYDLNNFRGMINVKEEEGEGIDNEDIVSDIAEEEENLDNKINEEEKQSKEASDEESQKNKKHRKLKKHPKRQREVSEDEEDYSANEEENEIDDEEESESESESKGYSKRKRHRDKKSSKRSRQKNKKRKSEVKGYFDIEAESDPDEDEEEDDLGGEITKEQQQKYLQEAVDRRDGRGSQYRSRRDQPIFQNMTEEDIENRYNNLQLEANQDPEDYDQGDLIVQQGRQPSISDPKLWLVHCRPGKEREAVETLFHKYFALNNKDTSSLNFDSLKGYIYVEAFKEANVREAIQGISFLRETSIKLVPLTEMTQVFNYDKIIKVDLKPKQWVRMKTGLYENDLAQVIRIDDPINRIYIRLVPRLSDQPHDSHITKKDKDKKESIADYNKRMKKNVKARQKLFNPKSYETEDVKFVHHPILMEQVYMWNKMAFKDGFLIKSVKAKSLITEEVVPRIEELRVFDLAKIKKGEDDNDVVMDIDNLINTIQETDISRKKKFVKGDEVKIVKGGLMNVTGKVISHASGLVTLMADVEGFDGVLEIPEDYVIKYLKPGEMIKVVNGPHIGKFGLIVQVKDDYALIFSDSTNSEFKVSCHDIVSSSHQTYETDHNSYFQLGDLVKISGTNNIGYVLHVEKYSLKLIDTRSEIKNVSLRDVTKMTQLRPNGMDAKRNPISKNDNVKIISGPNKGRKGVIRNIYNKFAFLYHQDIAITNGIFVDKTENLEIMGSELLNDNYDMSGSKINFKRIPDEIMKLIGQTIKIVKGHWKGYIGVLKRVTDKHASIELASRNKIITLNLDDIQDIKEGGYNNNGDRNSKFDSVMSTPRSNNGIKTPAYYPQTPSYNPTSPKWNPTATPNYWTTVSPNPHRDNFMSPGRKNNY